MIYVVEDDPGIRELEVLRASDKRALRRAALRKDSPFWRLCAFNCPSWCCWM